MTERSAIKAVHACAVAYCEAIYQGRVEVFEELCHERFLMSAGTGDGGAAFWDKAAYMERVASRGALDGPSCYDILSVEVAGNETARVHLWIDVPPRRFEDHLGFLRVDGVWRLITKVFRIMQGPAMET